MLGLDRGVFDRKAHEISVREALIWTGIWISVALTFNLGVCFWFGPHRALEFLSGYVIEKALSLDSIFVFIVVFSVFAVPPKLQRRVLFWGIFGALVMRAVFIVLGAALLQRFHRARLCASFGRDVCSAMRRRSIVLRFVTPQSHQHWQFICGR